ncbi:hypothetical protein TREMEDRAFT_62922 [Tremella mesenterica DSM 1558]|uniref:uncharacterized protein n=1 Tax=Tremella mesenterica (strain ATCC 24925 / CBS 8224 / DSM 1558 / NBRC 9311 / NRRL Y-6157 / RJB 2259-6 / UBC 559-6) TaxID=578456 RepID=UPI0003F493C5|nr:uncharacterized protein TREMEDRAFT_62922 [Tremella mesenterica DSM 1558]EIW69194.1 hypothetical protein TREMEDRAFT_62922 [Tremella mesenterica DSM 1558]
MQPHHPLPPLTDGPSSLPILSHNGYPSLPQPHHVISPPVDVTSNASTSRPLPPPRSAAYQQPPPEVLPIPQPVPRAPYAPPVFRTFQDRKREKEASLWNRQDGYSTPPTAMHPTLGSSHSIPSVGIMDSPVTPHNDSPAKLPYPAPQPPPRSRPLPSPLPMTPPLSSHGSPVKPPIYQLPYSPLQSTIERSDTISSVRSLDRVGFGSPSKRPLPKPPVVVAASKSLDRGIPNGLSDFRRPTRKQPSTVEESELEEGIGALGLGRSTPAPPRSPIIKEPSVSGPYPVISLPVIAKTTDPKSPAKFTPLPALNLPDSDEDEPPSAGIAFTGLPVIAVSSEEPEQRIQSVPSIIEPGGASRSESLTRLQPNAAIICSACGEPIIGRILSAMNQRWHPQCFTCGECGENLEHVSSYEWEGKPYCHLDFHDKFAYRCHHCKTPIVDSRFVTLNDEALGQRYYHELHFFCSECGDPFLDPSNSSAPGTEHTGAQDEVETNDFVIHKGHPYCERCHLRLHKPKCKGCSQPIPDMAVSAMGTKWHKECFVCQRCGQGFGNDLFFPKEGKAFCTECYESTLR